MDDSGMSTDESGMSTDDSLISPDDPLTSGNESRTSANDSLKSPSPLLILHLRREARGDGQLAQATMRSFCFIAYAAFFWRYSAITC